MKAFFYFLYFDSLQIRAEELDTTSAELEELRRDIARGRKHDDTLVFLDYETAHKYRVQVIEDRVAKFAAMAQRILLSFETLAAELRDAGTGVKT
jgi:hypothetical protein